VPGALAQSGKTDSKSGIGQALLAVGDQWSLLMLQRAFLKHTRRFAEWRDELGMSESVLAARLRELVAAGLLEPSPYRADGRTRTEYLLTKRARELWPFLVSIWSWERARVARPVPLPDLVHERCGRRADVTLGCGGCGAAPVSARDTRTERGPASTFADVALPRHHRRTVREHAPSDPLSYFPETMEILGDRWSTVLLAAAFLGVRRFAGFESELGVAPSILSDRLRRFTEFDVFVQRDLPGRGHEYRLTDKGLAFFPTFAFLVDWAQRWHPGAPGSEITIRHAACDKPLAPWLRCDSCLEPLARQEIHFDLTPLS
jgi:DNA-binding HxlR family transcriptional regulator